MVAQMRLHHETPRPKSLRGAVAANIDLPQLKDQQMASHGPTNHLVDPNGLHRKIIQFLPHESVQSVYIQ